MLQVMWLFSFSQSKYIVSEYSSYSTYFDIDRLFVSLNTERIVQH